MKVWFETETRLCLMNGNLKECFVKENAMNDFKCDGSEPCIISTESMPFYCEKGIKSEYETCKIDPDFGTSIQSESLVYYCESKRDSLNPHKDDVFKCKSFNKDYHSQIQETTTELNSPTIQALNIF